MTATRLQRVAGIAAWAFGTAMLTGVAAEVPARPRCGMWIPLFYGRPAADVVFRPIASRQARWRSRVGPSAPWRVQRQ